MGDKFGLPVRALALYYVALSKGMALEITSQSAVSEIMPGLLGFQQSLWLKLI